MLIFDLPDMVPDNYLTSEYRGLQYGPQEENM